MHLRHRRGHGHPHRGDRGNRPARHRGHLLGRRRHLEHRHPRQERRGIHRDRHHRRRRRDRHLGAPAAHRRLHHLGEVPVKASVPELDATALSRD